MKRNRNGHSRTVYAILALWLCITLVPFSSFAGSVPENGVENGDNTELILGQDEDGAEALQAEEQYPDEAADELSAEPEDTAEPEEQAGEEYQDEIEVQRPAEADAAIERQDAGSRCAPGTHVLQRVEAVPATCMKQGIKGHSVCTVCGALFDYNMQNEVTEQSLIIPVTAHTWSKYTDIVKPTIDKNGIRRHYCAVCGTYYDEDIVYGVVPATGKSFKLDGNKLQFKSAVAKSVPSFMKEARIRDIWIKAAKRRSPSTGHLPKEWSVSTESSFSERPARARCIKRSSGSLSRTAAAARQDGRRNLHILTKKPRRRIKHIPMF